VPSSPGVDVVSDLRPGDAGLWPLLRGCAIFAFPSEIDQAPNAVLEAMAAGLPVVAVATAAVPEMVRHGETGFVVASGDDDALRDALELLIDDPALRASMGARGRAWMLERYDAARATDALVDILHEAVALGPRSAT
jgi:glycosyltransferase involved in cell wall biosynthesis